MDLLDWMRSNGGVCTVQAARNHVSQATLDGLRASQMLWTPLRGWVALAGQRDDVTWALQLGGVVSCVSAFRRHGIWIPHGPQHIHVRVNRETHSERVDRTELLQGASLHRLHRALPEHRPQFGVDSPLHALATATGCLDDDALLAAADSALAARTVSKAALLELASQLPRRRRRALERAGGAAGSGTESLFIAMLLRANIRFVQQAELWPNRYVDVLIGRCLVVELDSQLWHATPEQQAIDRARDAALVARGYIPLRFTYEQVLFQPEYVLRTILDIVRSRRHLRMPLS